MDGISVEVGVRRVPVAVQVGESALAPVSVELAGGGAMAPAYPGPYQVTPEAYFAQTLETEGKRMRHDVEVEAIPYYLATNPAGGYTATIG